MNVNKHEAIQQKQAGVITAAIAVYALLLVPLWAVLSTVGMMCLFGGVDSMCRVGLFGVFAYAAIAPTSIIWAIFARQKGGLRQFYIALAIPVIWVGGLVVGIFLAT